MKYKVLILILFSLLAILNFGCTQSVSQNITIPAEVKIDLKQNWEIKLDSEFMCSTSDDQFLYVATEGQIVDIIDIKDGTIEKSIKLQTPKDRQALTISVANNILALNYSNFMPIVDIESGKTIHIYKASDLPFVLIGYDQMVYNNSVIFANSGEDYIYAIEAESGELIWEIEGDHQKGTSFGLYNYRDMYFYTDGKDSIYYQIDPGTGKIINQYKMIKDLELNTDSQSSFVWVSSEKIQDNKFNRWLINKNIGPFEMTEDGHFYANDEHQFYYLDRDGKMLWKINLNDEINFATAYKGYAVINCKNKAYLLNMNNKQIVWEMKSFDTDNMWIEFIQDSLIIYISDGTIKSYDVSDL